MDDVLKVVGIRIREYRKNHGLTQDEVAERASLSQSYIGSVERGEQNLTLVSLERILHAVGMRFDELFCHFDNNGYNPTEYILNEIVTKLEDRSINDQKFVLHLVDNLISWKDS